MAGEFAVASELNRQKVLASVTYGPSKAADIFALDDNMRRVVRIEVKATDKQRWVLGTNVARQPSGDVFWVLVHFPQLGQSPGFFVLSDQEIHEIWKKDHGEYCRKYKQKNGTDFVGVGVPGVGTKDPRIRTHKDKWDKIKTRLLEPGKKHNSDNTR